MKDFNYFFYSLKCNRLSEIKNLLRIHRPRKKKTKLVMAKISCRSSLIIAICVRDKECVGGSEFVGVLHLIDYYALTQIRELEQIAVLAERKTGGQKNRIRFDEFINIIAVPWFLRREKNDRYTSVRLLPFGVAIRRTEFTIIYHYHMSHWPTMPLAKRVTV